MLRQCLGAGARTRMAGSSKMTVRRFPRPPSPPSPSSVAPPLVARLEFTRSGYMRHESGTCACEVSSCGWTSPLTQRPWRTHSVTHSSGCQERNTPNVPHMQRTSSKARTHWHTALGRPARHLRDARAADTLPCRLTTRCHGCVAWRCPVHTPRAPVKPRPCARTPR